HLGQRPRSRNSREFSHPHLRPLHSGRLDDRPAEGRHRPRPRHLQAPGGDDAGPHRLRRSPGWRYDLLVRAAEALDRSPMPARRPLNRVCYVEDDEDIQRIVRMSLERIGKMTVAVVSDPTKAIDAIVAFKPDLVMLDWMMPAMDGPTL